MYVNEDFLEISPLIDFNYTSFTRIHIFIENYLNVLYKYLGSAYTSKDFSITIYILKMSIQEVSINYQLKPCKSH